MSDGLCTPATGQGVRGGCEHRRSAALGRVFALRRPLPREGVGIAPRRHRPRRRVRRSAWARRVARLRLRPPRHDRHNSGIMDVMRERYASSADAGPRARRPMRVADARHMPILPDDSVAVVVDKLDALHGDQHKLDMLRECARVLDVERGGIPSPYPSPPPRVALLERVASELLDLRLRFAEGDPKYGHASVFVAVLGRIGRYRPQVRPRGRGRDGDIPGDGRGTRDGGGCATATVLAASHQSHRGRTARRGGRTHAVRRVRLGVRSAGVRTRGVHAISKDGTRPVPSPRAEECHRRGTRRSRRNDSLQIRTPRWRLVSTPSTLLQRRLVSSRKSRLAHSRLRAEPTRAGPSVSFVSGTPPPSPERRGIVMSTPSGLTRSSLRRFRLRLRRGAHSPCAAFSSPPPGGGSRRRRAVAGCSRLSPGRDCRRARPRLGGSAAPSGASPRRRPCRVRPTTRPGGEFGSSVIREAVGPNRCRLCDPCHVEGDAEILLGVLADVLAHELPDCLPRRGSPRSSCVGRRGEAGKLRRATSPPVE